MAVTKSPVHALCQGQRSAPRECGSVHLALIVAVATIVMAGFAAVLLSRALRVDEPPLRIAINAWPGYEFATLAREKGFFAEEGVEVEILELSSLSDSRRAFERGQVDGFFATLVEVLVAREIAGRPSQIAMVTDWSDGADVIMSRAGVGSVEELRGKRIGVETDSVNAIVLARALERHGLHLSDVHVVPCPQLRMRAALEAGEVDAVVTYPPFSLEVASVPGAKQVFSTREIPNEIVDVLAVAQAVTETRAEAVEGFKRAFFRAQEYAKQQPAEAFAIMAQRQRVSVADFEAALSDGLRLVGAKEQEQFLGHNGSLRDTMQRTRDAMKSIGMLPHGRTTGVAASVAGD